MKKIKVSISAIRCSFIIIILVVGLLVVTGCGGDLEKNPSGEGKIIMKISHTQFVSHRQHQSLLKFKEIVETNTNKAIEVQIFSGGQLGSDAQQIEMVKSGSLQAMRGNVLEAVAPELLIYSMPFLFTDIESVHKITRGPIGKKIADYAEKNNIIILATGDAGGLSHITNSVSDDELYGACQYTPDPFFVSLKWYESLDSSQKNVIKVAAVEMMIYNDELVEKETKSSLKKLENNMNVTVLKHEDREKFMEQVKLVSDYYMNRGLFTAQDLEEIKKTVR